VAELPPRYIGVYSSNDRFAAAQGDHMKGRILQVTSLLLLAAVRQAQGGSNITAEVDAVFPQSEALYLYIHQHPELSLHEQQTAAKLAAGLRELGYEVSTGIGGTGVVGVLKNGSGPVVMLRTELDALVLDNISREYRK
jgi:hypothetical protein